MRLKESIMVFAMSALTVMAAEHPVKPGKFEQEVSIQALAVPVKAHEISINPEVWGDYPIVDLVDHGAKVKKGEVLIKVDTESLDEAILEAEKARAVDTMNLEKLKQELAELEVNTRISLEEEQRKYDQAKQDYAYFKKVELPNMVAEAKLTMEKYQWRLDGEKEELKQLLKMYEADGLTEETEEIIVQRSRNSVKAADFSYQQGMLEGKRKLEVVFPRMEKNREVAMERATNDWQAIQKSWPRAVELKKAEVEKAVRADQRKAEYLSELKADRKLADIVSPVDGYVYYGEFVPGGWSQDMARKILSKGGKVAGQKVLMTVVPEDADLKLEGKAGEWQAAMLARGMSGIASPAYDPWQRFKVKVAGINAVPVQNGSWVIHFESEAEVKPLVAGSSLDLNFVSYSKADAISVPAAAVESHPDGSYSVEVKMADGKTESKAIKVGRVSTDSVEVLEGLEDGQVVVYEEKK